jgi:hypothetical protein
MKTKVKILLGVVLLMLISSGIYIYSKRNVINLKYATIKKMEYDEEPVVEDLANELEPDSLFFKQICSDDNYSGKLLVLFYENNNSKEKTPINEYIGSWRYDKKVDANKIIGYHGFTNTDTLMYWIYDEVKSELTDEKGMIYKRVKN